MVNVARLMEVRTWAREQWTRREVGLESEWDQGTWWTVGSCGTVCCIAGKTAMLAGWEVPLGSEIGEYGWIMVDPNGERMGADEIAEIELGLTSCDAAALFHSNNTVTDVETIIDRLIAGTFDAGTWEDERRERRRAEWLSEAEREEVSI